MIRTLFHGSSVLAIAIATSLLAACGTFDDVNLSPDVRFSGMNADQPLFRIAMKDIVGAAYPDATGSTPRAAVLPAVRNTEYSTYEPKPYELNTDKYHEYLSRAAQDQGSDNLIVIHGGSSSVLVASANVNLEAGLFDARTRSMLAEQLGVSYLIVPEYANAWGSVYLALRMIDASGRLVNAYSNLGSSSFESFDALCEKIPAGAVIAAVSGDENPLSRQAARELELWLGAKNAAGGKGLTIVSEFGYRTLFDSNPRPASGDEWRVLAKSLGMTHIVKTSATDRGAISWTLVDASEPPESDDVLEESPSGTIFLRPEQRERTTSTGMRIAELLVNALLFPLKLIAHPFTSAVDVTEWEGDFVGSYNFDNLFGLDVYIGLYFEALFAHPFVGYHEVDDVYGGGAYRPFTSRFWQDMWFRAE
ncbi:MAG: hypothetical protein NUW37_02055 [Planctomycetes bacterium]|nr:hypothetical protein [Planctomycetota bacterium]